MKQDNTIAACALTFVLASVLMFSSLAMRISANTPEHELSIPYEGLALRWESNMRLYYENQLQLQRNDTTIYLYSERNSPSIFKREEISPQIAEDTVDILTREVLSGPLIGTITSHWINTTQSVGDLVPIYLANITYAIKAINVIFILPSVSPKTWGAEINCFELEYVGVESNWTITDLIYYDMKTGIKVFQNTTNVSTEDTNLILRSTLILEDTEKDTDEDGLTDLEELFVTLTNPLNVDTDNDGLNDEEEYEVQAHPLNSDPDMDGLKDGEEVKIYHTNPLLADSDNDGVKDGYEVSLGTDPLKSDTDNDLWNDKIDIMPNNVFIPNGLIVLLFAAPLGTLLWHWKKEHVKVEAQSSTTIY